jgi:hypothetical protein
MRLVQTGTTADGLVAAASDPTAEHAHPMIVFTAQGKIVHYRQNGYSAQPGRGHVRILHDPADPAGTAIIRSFSTLWLPIILPAALGGAAMGIAILSYLLDT